MSKSLRAVEWFRLLGEQVFADSIFEVAPEPLIDNNLLGGFVDKKLIPVESKPIVGDIFMFLAPEIDEVISFERTLLKLKSDENEEDWE